MPIKAEDQLSHHNDLSNLMWLCASCHTAVHDGFLRFTLGDNAYQEVLVQSTNACFDRFNGLRVRGVPPVTRSLMVRNLAERGPHSVASSVNSIEQEEENDEQEL